MPPNLQNAITTIEKPWATSLQPPQPRSPEAEVKSPVRSNSVDSTTVPVSEAQLPVPSVSTFSLPKRKLVHQPDQIAPKKKKKIRLSDAQRVDTIANALSTILDCLDDDPNREGLRKTPVRYAKALLALTEGYSKSPEQVLGDAEFHENHTEMVMVRNIDVFSLCEHHLLPFHGTCHVSYIPAGSIIGLSKIARIIDVFARRFQVQERLTAQIADAIESATKATGVMVYVTCTHMCMAMRGVEKVSTETSTTAVRGNYASDPQLRLEFLNIVNSGHSSRR